jgi:DNA-binding PadR family transcriptional regulator
MSRRFFRHGELPLALLALIAERPRHGYEAMAELTRLFGPRYRASPGSVYPAIEALEAEGLIEGVAQDGRSVYRATDAGHEALQTRAEMLAALGLRTGVHLGADESLDTQLTRLKARLRPLSGRVDPALAAQILERAAREIETASKTNRRRHGR